MQLLNIKREWIPAKGFNHLDGYYKTETIKEKGRSEAIFLTDVRGGGCLVTHDNCKFETVVGEVNNKPEFCQCGVELCYHSSSEW